MARKSKKGSEFLSAFGIMLEIVKAIVDAVRAEGGTDDDLRRVVVEKGLAKRIAKVIMASVVKPVAEAVAQATTAVAKEVATVFKLAVEYIQPTYEELKKSFDWVNSDYRVARFEPIERCKDVARVAGEITFRYVHMDRNASTDEILAEMVRLGLRPALYEELLAFAKQFPNEQRQYPIVALGSVWVHPRGSRYVAYLYRDGSERFLNLGWYVFGWNGICRFLAVAVSK